jgi:hypothetical protein
VPKLADRLRRMRAWLPGRPAAPPGDLVRREELERSMRARTDATARPVPAPPAPDRPLRQEGPSWLDLVGVLTLLGLLVYGAVAFSYVTFLRVAVRVWLVAGFGAVGNASIYFQACWSVAAILGMRAALGPMSPSPGWLRMTSDAWRAARRPATPEARRARNVGLLVVAATVCSWSRCSCCSRPAMTTSGRHGRRSSSSRSASW